MSLYKDFLAFLTTLSDNAIPDCLSGIYYTDGIFCFCDGGHIFAEVYSVMMRNVGRQFKLFEAAV
jgi:hypothetical protein